MWAVGYRDRLREYNKAREVEIQEAKEALLALHIIRSAGVTVHYAPSFDSWEHPGK